MPSLGLGESIPPDTAHAVSVSLPTWASNVGYEEGKDWVISRLNSGYPRIKAFAESIVEKYGKPGQVAMLFPNRKAAARCLTFVHQRATPPSVLEGLSVVHLALDGTRKDAAPFRPLSPTISAVLMQPEAFPFAKQYWQHSGDGISSRRAEYCHKLFSEGLLVRQADRETSSSSSSSPAIVAGMKHRGPRRYQRAISPTSPTTAGNGHRSESHTAEETAKAVAEEDEDETSRYLEERFGRNLDLSFVQRAKAAIQRRITGAMTADDEVDQHPEAAASAAAATTTATTAEKHANIRGSAVVHEDDVFLTPCGMNAIFTAHRCLLSALPDKSKLRSINYGFPYTDTLKLLEKFGAGCLFYGHASEEELDDLEKRLRGGERFLALFCEFPGNPMLSCPNLRRIRALADEFDFCVVVDETIGTFVNVNVLPYSDIVVSSLTKIFSGDCNVMGGSVVLNRASRHYTALRHALDTEYDQDSYWPEDVIFMERNSRDFVTRIDRINANAEALCPILKASPLVAEVYYPKDGPWKDNYELCRLGSGVGVGGHGDSSSGGAHHHRVGGYGGLLSFVFHHKEHAIAFYDAVETAKGPSLGTNFTLTSPYVVLAHYAELDWCRQLGINPDLLRVSVGLEDTAELCAIFEKALAAAAAVEVKET